MNLSDPTRAVTPTLDGPILAVLATAGRPLTVGEVATAAVRGSEIGVRRSLARLVDQGIVRATVMGRNAVHELNREHIAAPIADILGGLRLELWSRCRTALKDWSPAPLLACVFGSAARGDGGVDSDIDMLLVHPPFPGDKPPAAAPNVLTALAGAVLSLRLMRPTNAVEAAKWERQVDDLRASVRDWTGNSLQVVDLSAYGYVELAQAGARLLEDARRDGVELANNMRRSKRNSETA